MSKLIRIKRILTSILLWTLIFSATSPVLGQNPVSVTYVNFKKSAEPGNPPAGYDRMWIGTDNIVRIKQPDGTVTEVGAGGGGFALQTETSFANNSTPAIWLKAPFGDTTDFLSFHDSSNNQMFSVGYLGGAYAQRFISAEGNFVSDTNSLYLKQANGSYGVELPRTGGIKFGPNYNGSAATDPSAWLDFTDTVEFSALTTGEKKLFWRNPALTYTWDTGAITNQRFFHLTAPTMAFDGASTVTKAATLAVSGAPIAGTNATITNPYALWVESGASQFDGNVLLGSSNTLLLGGATTPTGSAVKLQIGTPATANNAVSLYIEPVASGYSAIAIQAQPSQSADLLQVVNSSGGKIAAIGNKGSLWSSPAGVASTLVLGDNAGAALTGSLVNNTIIGSYAAMSLATGTGNVFIGNNVGYSDSNITNSIIIGSYECDANNTATNGPFLAIGVAGGDEIAAANVAVFGSSTVPYNDWYFGRGYSGSTVTDITFQPTFATGADKAGADFFIRGGAGTGDGEPGTIQFQTTAPLSSGSTAQTQSTIATITYGGLELNTGRFLVPQIKGTGTTPSAAVGVGAGTGATVSVTGTNLAGQITITTGTGTPDGGVIFTLTFSSSMFNAPFTQITPANSLAAQVAGAWYVESTTTTVVMTGLGVWPTEGELKFNYFNPQ